MQNFENKTTLNNAKLLWKRICNYQFHQQTRWRQLQQQGLTNYNEDTNNYSFYNNNEYNTISTIIFVLVFNGL